LTEQLKINLLVDERLFFYYFAYFVKYLSLKLNNFNKWRLCSCKEKDYITEKKRLYKDNYIVGLNTHKHEKI